MPLIYLLVHKRREESSFDVFDTKRGPSLSISPLQKKGSRENTQRKGVKTDKRKSICSSSHDEHFLWMSSSLRRIGNQERQTLPFTGKKQEKKGRTQHDRFPSRKYELPKKKTKLIQKLREKVFFCRTRLRTPFVLVYRRDDGECTAGNLSPSFGFKNFVRRRGGTRSRTQGKGRACLTNTIQGRRTRRQHN
jgi:hypothetical protein